MVLTKKQQEKKNLEHKAKSVWSLPLRVDRTKIKDA